MKENRDHPSSDPASRGHSGSSPRQALLSQAGEGVGCGVLSRVFVLAALALATAACDPRDCALGIASGDCAPQGSPLAAFPQDDAICRTYGLAPGTRDYRLCREAKAHERALTERETDYGFLANPLTPNIK